MKITRTVMDITDDLTGEPIEPGQEVTVKFGYAGREYEMDLSPANATVFDELLAPYVKVARQPKFTVVPAVGRTGRTPKPSGAPSEDSIIRAWCAEQGVDASGRGRVKAEFRTMWEAAGSPGA